MVGRPNTLPGFWGPLASALGGVQGLATRLAIPERSIRGWANNEHGISAFEASRVAEACAANGIAPAVYEYPEDTQRVIANTPSEGWVEFYRCDDAWADRKRFYGPVGNLTPMPKKGLPKLASTGFPYKEALR